MRAVLHTGVAAPWASVFGARPWALLPVGNRPLLEYWIEFCVEAGIREIRLVLGDGAEEIERYVGDGRRWGVQVEYSFLRDASDPDRFLRRDPSRWTGGLLYVRAPVFPRRQENFRPPELAADARFAGPDPRAPACLLLRDPATLEAFVATGKPPIVFSPFSDLGLEPVPLDSLRGYFELNLALAGGEAARYTTPGYFAQEQAYVGLDAILPASVDLRPPLMIGDHVRIGALATIGPRAVISNQVVVDDQTEIRDSLVLDGSYVGRGLELNRKIVAGCRLIDPDDGTWLDVEDAWVLAPLRGPRHRVGAAVRTAAGWLAAWVVLALQVLPYVCLYPVLLAATGARFVPRRGCSARGRPLRLSVFDPGPGPAHGLVRVFRALSLDLMPRFMGVIRGQLRCCGQPLLFAPQDEELRQELKHYRPGAISYADLNPLPLTTAEKRVDALYYERRASVAEDTRLFFSTLLRRLFGQFDRGEEPSW